MKRKPQTEPQRTYAAIRAELDTNPNPPPSPLAGCFRDTDVDPRFSISGRKNKKQWEWTPANFK
jgi:hypothetical protein